MSGALVMIGAILAFLGFIAGALLVVNHFDVRRARRVARMRQNAGVDATVVHTVECACGKHIGVNAVLTAREPTHEVQCQYCRRVHVLELEAIKRRVTGKDRGYVVGQEV